MESLSDTAAKHARRLARRPEMPSWTPILMGLLGVFFVVYLFVALITPAPKSAQTVSTPTTTIPVSSTPTTSQTTTVPSQMLPSVSPDGAAGSTVSVPSAAVTVAQHAAIGVYTTKLSSVPLATGSTFPATSQAYPDAQLVSTVALVSPATPLNATTATLRVSVNPGPPASPGNLYLDITVVDQSGQWSYQSGG